MRIRTQLLVDKYNSDRAELNLARQNTTLTETKSIFIFDEDSVTAFLAWQYLPVAIATVVAICWEPLDVAVRRLEPFYQLCSNDGGIASNAMCLDYVAKFTPTVPYSAVCNRHYAVAISATLYIITASVIPVFTGGLWTIDWGSLSPSSQRPKGPNIATISVHAGFTITAQADSTIRTTFQLTANRSPGHPLYLTNADRTFAGDRGDGGGWWLSKRAIWSAEVFIWLGQAAIAAAIYKVARALGSDSMAESIKPTIAKMVFTLCTSFGGMMWQSIQRDVQVFEPWRQLTRNGRGSIFEALVQSDIVSLGLVGGMAVSLRRGWLVSLWASFSVVMVHVAVVFVPPLLELAYAAGILNDSPYEQRVFGVLQGASGLALAVTGVAIHLVIFGNMLFLLLSGRSRPLMPRRPTTIAS
ncbi:uncharacterized protein N7446_010802 [Penicillium canescens]|uniref:Uncharacterized protein n=1 Tax=Penicillium canescens TaxID=5083 RepID=A0AAD6N8A2_PENCN|nr:uncharacterized protein N7446_010802 [Penicillium canescens]KAJ6041308.1 hypothetical protein N7460_006698 [Penicillium canescens]KAJ6050693.1 hypothetical protein N7446_010802 [Penicillium canescens]